MIAVAALTVLTIRAFAQASPVRPAPSDRKITLKFKDAALKDDTGAAFGRALKALKSEQYSARHTHNDGKVDDFPASPATGMKIDKVTKSQLAQSSKDEFTPIGIHVTQLVTSDSATEIQAVLDTLQ